MQTKTVQVQRAITINHNETLVRDTVQRRRVEVAQVQQAIAINHNETLVRDRNA